jgi:hypothetical protein
MNARHGTTDLAGLVHHHDAGTSIPEVLRPPVESGQYTSIAFTERLAIVGGVSTATISASPLSLICQLTCGGTDNGGRDRATASGAP